MKKGNRVSKNPWPINLAMDLCRISKEEFQHPEIIYRKDEDFDILGCIEKFKHLTVEGVLDLFDFSPNPYNLSEERIKNIIISYYKDGKTFERIGNDYGFTGERAKQLTAKGLRILRHRLMKIEI